MFATIVSPSDNGGIGVAFTDREGGASIGALESLNLGRSDIDDPELIRKNMAALRTATGISRLVGLHQVHGIEVYRPDQDQRDWSGDEWLGDAVEGAGRLPIADAALTAQPGLALMVRVADCVPVILAAREERIIAVAHAGREGLLDGVLATTVQAMKESGATRISGWVGPHICKDCYEVPESMARDAVERIPECRSRTSWGTPSIDLGSGAYAQLRQLGVTTIRVDPCTFTSSRFFSHRGDGPDTGRHIGLVWLSG